MIRVVLSRPKKFHLSSWLIMWATSFDASHASIHWTGSGTFKGQRMVLESTAHGVTIVHPSIWDATNRPVHVFQLTRPEEGMAALGEMWKSLGADYDYKSLFRFAWRLLLRKLFGLRLAVPNTPTAMFCSELVARWLVALGRISGSPIHAPPPDATSPRDLVSLMLGMKVFEAIPPEASAVFGTPA